jgi:hypothetical protein
MPDHYIIEVTLQKVIPRIWRRFKITTEAMFVDLHEAIQDACGWENRHLFQFRDAKGRILAGLPEGPDDVTTPDAKINPIAKPLGSGKGKKVLYVYDLGDFWRHDVEVVDVAKEGSERLARRLLAGERAFPPEDSGGVREYEKCVKVALGRKKDSEVRRWLRGWNPEMFDFRATARFFNQRRLSRRARYTKSFLADNEDL